MATRAIATGECLRHVGCRLCPVPLGERHQTQQMDGQRGELGVVDGPGNATSGLRRGTGSATCPCDKRIKLYPAKARARQAVAVSGV